MRRLNAVASFAKDGTAGEPVALFAALALGGVVVYAGLLSFFGLGAGNVLVMAAIFVSALTSSIAGFAFSAICGAMLFHLIDGQAQVVKVMLSCSIGIQRL